LGRTRRQRLGDDAEALARHHLRRAGLDCLATNYRCRLGEIDLVMRAPDVLVIAEVRCRGPGSRLTALDSISPTKQRRIVLATEQFLCRHPQHAALPIRFDVVGIDVGADGEARLQWLQDAFRPA
jgi:putative endonuclease